MPLSEVKINAGDGVMTTAFVPSRISRLIQGFYQVPEHLTSNLPIEELERNVPHINGHDGGWMMQKCGSFETECVLNEVLILIRQNKQWAGVSKRYLIKMVSGNHQSLLCQHLGQLDDILTQMQSAGWIELYFNKDDKPVIYLTQKTITAIPQPLPAQISL